MSRSAREMAIRPVMVNKNPCTRAYPPDVEATPSRLGAKLEGSWSPQDLHQGIVRHQLSMARPRGVGRRTRTRLRRRQRCLMRSGELQLQPQRYRPPPPPVLPPRGRQSSRREASGSPPGSDSAALRDKGRAQPASRAIHSESSDGIDPLPWPQRPPSLAAPPPLAHAAPTATNHRGIAPTHSRCLRRPRRRLRTRHAAFAGGHVGGRGGEGVGRSGGVAS